MTIVSTLTSHSDTVLTIRCVTPKDIKDTVILPDSESASSGSKWKCVLTNRRPLLHISVSSCDPLSADGVKVMRIRSVQGKQIARTNVQIFENDFTATTSVKMDSIENAGRLSFDIVLSTSSIDFATPALWHFFPDSNATISTLMKDTPSMNTVFSFRLSTGKWAGLWFHQSVLGKYRYLDGLITKIGLSSSSSFTPTYKALATEFPLECYCSLVSFLYKGVITTEVDLRRFAVAFNVHGQDHSKYRPSDADLSAISPTSVDTGVKRVTAVKDLFQLASMYEVNEVREYCRDKILATITASNVLEILFEYAYRYSDLRDVIVQYVTDNMDELLLTGQDPFGAYSGHPQRQSILDAVLKLTLEA